MSDEDFNEDSEWFVKQLLLIFIGERFKNREMVIREWIIKDKERDHQYENAMQPVGVKCRNCSSPMRVINKELHEKSSNLVQNVPPFSLPTTS